MKNKEEKDFKKDTIKRMELLVDKYLTLLEKEKLTSEEAEYLKRNEKFCLRVISKMFSKEIPLNEKPPIPIYGGSAMLNY